MPVDYQLAYSNSCSRHSKSICPLETNVVFERFLSISVQLHGVPQGGCTVPHRISCEVGYSSDARSPLCSLVCGDPFTAAAA